MGHNLLSLMKISIRVKFSTDHFRLGPAHLPFVCILKHLYEMKNLILVYSGSCFEFCWVNLGLGQNNSSYLDHNGGMGFDHSKWKMEDQFVSQTLKSGLIFKKLLSSSEATTPSMSPAFVGYGRISCIWSYRHVHDCLYRDCFQ